MVASALDFVLEGLCALRKIAREDERYVGGTEPAPRRAPSRREDRLDVEDEDIRLPGGKKKYYN